MERSILWSYCVSWDTQCVADNPINRFLEVPARMIARTGTVLSQYDAELDSHVPLQ